MPGRPRAGLSIEEPALTFDSAVLLVADADDHQPTSGSADSLPIAFTGTTPPTQRGVSVSLTGVPLVLFLVTELVYYFALEARSGQTVGKRIMRVRVVIVDGSPANDRAVLLRTVGRVVDILPAFCLVGWLVLKRDNHPRQRRGDRLAHTTVMSA